MTSSTISGFINRSTDVLEGVSITIAFLTFARSRSVFIGRFFAARIDIQLDTCLVGVTCEWFAIKLIVSDMQWLALASVIVHVATGIHTTVMVVGASFVELSLHTTSALSVGLVFNPTRADR